MSAEGTLRTFNLAESFINEYKGKQPAWGFNGLGYLVFLRTYSRTKPDGTLEEFWETCRRVVEGTYDIQKKHCKSLRLTWDDRKAQKSAQEMYRRMWEFKFLPPGRGLWTMGTELTQKTGAVLNNCAFLSTEFLKMDLAEPFCWLMDMSMLGVGVGFDTKGAGTLKVQKPLQDDKFIFVVPDTREGWVDALRATINPFSGKGSLPADYDFSQVRPAGAPIKTFGGTASGPEPLKELLNATKQILLGAVGSEITSEHIVDLCTLIGKCVVSGNVRRSALLSLGEANDDLFLDLKNPETNKEALFDHRWAANNSIKATVGMDYSKVAEMTAKNGEPGYLWLDSVRAFSRMDGKPDWIDTNAKGTNPCSEQTLHHLELCTLVETFPAHHDSAEDYRKTLKYAYLYAKTVTLVPTHHAQTNAVIFKNRRIGCSMSGIVQAIQKFGRRRFFEDYCDKSYNYLTKLDQTYSDWLCIRTSIKKTSVKPSGSTSLLCGATAGIHYPHSQYYIRRVRLQENSPLVTQLTLAGYKLERDAYSPNTVVVEFPVEEKNFDRSKDQVSMWEQLELTAQMQQYWADNQVSVTVTFNKEEAKQIKYALELYETRLKSVSFLPLSDHGYEQAPYETITKEQYEQMVSKITALKPDNAEHEETAKFCDGEVCLT